MKAIATDLRHYYGTRWQANFPGFFREYGIYIFAVSVAALLDFASTYRFMSAGGIADELHPIIRGISHVLGPFFGPLVGKFGQMACLLWFTITFRRFARIVFIPVILIYVYAAWFNVWGVELYTPRFYRLLGW